MGSPGLSEHQCGDQDYLAMSGSGGSLSQVTPAITHYPHLTGCLRTTKRTISITTLHNNEEVPLYRRGHEATKMTELVDRTSAYPAMDRETIR